MTDATMTAAIAQSEKEVSERSPLARAFIYAALVAVSVLMLYPLLWMIASSFKPDDEIFTSTSLLPHAFSADAYRRGWNGLSVGFGQMFFNSLVVCILVVIGNLLSCSMAAYAFTRLRFKGRGFWSR